MSLIESKDYDAIKKAILERYGLNSWEYREKFRSCRQASGETYREFSVRLRSYFDHWRETESIDSDFDKLVDLVMRELLMFTADHDLQMWLREHQPKSVTELINLQRLISWPIKNQTRGTCIKENHISISHLSH